MVFIERRDGDAGFESAAQVGESLLRGALSPSYALAFTGVGPEREGSVPRQDMGSRRIQACVRMESSDAAGRTRPFAGEERVEGIGY